MSRLHTLIAPVLASLGLLAASPASASDEGKVKLGSPGLSGVNLSPEKGAYFLEQLAASLEALGIRVITAQQIAALLGVEREKQILGCGDEQTAQCLVELANAVGVDGLITGSLGRFGDTYQLNVVVVNARDGAMLGSYSGRADGEPALLDLLGTAARNLAPEIGSKLHKPVVRYPHQQLSINPIGPVVGLRFKLTVINLEFERALTDRWSVYGAPEALVSPPRAASEIFMSGMALALGARWHPAGPAPLGFFVGGRVHLMNGFLHAEENALERVLPVTPGALASQAINGGVMFVGLGAETGTSWDLFNGLYLSIGLGVNLDLVQIAGDLGVSKVLLFPLPFGRVNVGWAF